MHGWMFTCSLKRYCGFRAMWNSRRRAFDLEFGPELHSMRIAGNLRWLVVFGNLFLFTLRRVLKS